MIPIEELICGGLRWGDTAIAGRARCRYGHSIESRRGFCHRPWTDLVGPDHPARFLAAFVDGLDAEAWDSLGTDLKGDPMGAGAYHPRSVFVSDGKGPLCQWRAERTLIPAMAAAVS